MIETMCPVCRHAVTTRDHYHTPSEVNEAFAEHYPEGSPTPWS